MEVHRHYFILYLLLKCKANVIYLSSKENKNILSLGIHVLFCNISLLINVFRSCWMHNRFRLKIYKVVLLTVDLLMEMSEKSVFVEILENCFWHQLTVIAESARFVVDVNQHKF